MSSCTECHGMAGETYDDHASPDCPLFKEKRQSLYADDEVNDLVATDDKGNKGVSNPPNEGDI